MSFAALVAAALDAAGHAPDSAPARWALDRAEDAGAQDAALNVAILAEAETRRGVRTVRG